MQLYQLPMDPNSKDLYVKCGDGILLWSVHTYLKLVSVRTSFSKTVSPISVKCHSSQLLPLGLLYLYQGHAKAPPGNAKCITEILGSWGKNKEIGGGGHSLNLVS